MRSRYYAGVAAFWVLCWSDSVEGTTMLRTFVNGTGQPVHDLHVVYETTGMLTNAMVYTGPSGPGASWVLKPRVLLDVVFNPNLPSGQSVTIKVVSSAPGEPLGIFQWWWTDQNTNAVGTTNKSNIRGDEFLHGTQYQVSQNDTYSIVNHGHHWGGTTRTTNSVTVNMYIKSFLSNLSPANQAAAESNILAAARQWANCTFPQPPGQVPIAGQGGNPTNDGAGLDPPVMAPSTTHHAKGAGRKFRSVTLDEAAAIRVKYPMGLVINLYPDMDRGTNQGIQVTWGTPRDKDEADSKGEGIPKAGDPNDPERTTQANITINSTKPWYYGADNDGDGYITNGDGPDVPKNSFDFYSIFKHELGHVLSFNHSGQNWNDQSPRFGDPEPSGSGRASGGPCPGCGTPDGSSLGEADDDEPGTVYFSSDQPGGYGGLDIWRAWWDGTNWVQENLGPGVNTPYDETDPFLASDGTTLLFSSDRPGGIGGFDLYESIYDLESNVWSQTQDLGTNINTPYDERHPSLTADMLTLFLVSDQPGGLGGWDIWSSEFIWGQGWSECYNLGSPVNSSSNEAAACINATGDGLIIASDRPGGFGGLDLWLSINLSSPNLSSTNVAGWSDPVNLGPTINSPANESDPSIRSDHAYLLFTSDRDPTGDQIYESYMRLPVQTYSDWVTNWFSDQDNTNPAVTGPFALDPGGVPNLLDYAFAGNPLLGQGSAGLTVYTVETTNGPAVEFLFSRPLLGYDLNYLIEVSPDLQTWHYNGDVPGAVYTDTVETDPSIDVEAVRFRPDASLGWPALFCRIAAQWP